MIPSLRIVPASAAELAADPNPPYIAWFEGERELLQVATGAAGLGIDLTHEQARVVASHAELSRLLEALEEAGSNHAQPLRDFLRPVEGWRLRSTTLPLQKPIVIGILNLTEDSFSGDGVGREVGAALERAEALRKEGAVIVDVGAESARADRPAMDEAEESRLVEKLVGVLAREGHVVSVDTYKARVARAALDAGAELVNDISGLTLGTAAAAEAMRSAAGYVLNYSYSVPKRRPESPPMYTDVVAETVGWMEQKLAELRTVGLARDSIAIDPGIAFGKSHDEDITVLRRIGELQTFGRPILLAHSRKNFIGSITGRPPAERDLETHVASALAYAQGVRIFRVHDPSGAKHALEMAAAIVSAKPGEFAPDAGSWPWRTGAAAPHMTREEADKAAPKGQRW